MLKRYLETTGASADTIDGMAFPDLIRTGAEQGLLASSWDVWADFRKVRNKTAHTYGEENAAEVFALIPKFRDDAGYLLAQLEERNGAA